MSILVICPGCGAKFQINEKFAGKQGACPKCKASIKVPSPDDVKVHIGEEYGHTARDKKGRSIGKPIDRKEPKITPVLVVGIVGSTLAVLVICWLLGETIQRLLTQSVGGQLLVGVALVAVSAPLVVGAYALLRNEDLEPYRGGALWIRAGICAVVYTALWGGYGLLPADFIESGWSWLFLAPPFIIVGASAAFACLDLGADVAFFHFSFYLLATMALRWAAGLPAIWAVAQVT